MFKGESLDSPTREHVDTMMSHVNGYARASLMKGRDDNLHAESQQFHANPYRQIP